MACWSSGCWFGTTAAARAAQRAAERFPGNPDAWMLLGQAWLAVYRHQEALASFEQALVLEERPDAALEAGDIYRRSGQFSEAAARFARVCRGWRPRRCGTRRRCSADVKAAEQALALWAGQGRGAATALRAAGASRRAG
jgi:tetratricopeptide (TPR) repeat protein